MSQNPAAAAKSLQSCPTLCDPIDGNPPGSPSLGFSRQEHWSGLPFPSPKTLLLLLLLSCFSRVWLFATHWTAAYQAPLSMGFSRQEYWSGVPLPSLVWPKNSSSVQSLSRVRLFEIPWIAAHQASLSITNSWSSLKLTSIESVMPSSHLILCRPLFLLPPIPPSIRVFSNESTLRMRYHKVHYKHYF